MDVIVDSRGVKSKAFLADPERPDVYPHSHSHTFEQASDTNARHRIASESPAVLKV